MPDRPSKITRTTTFQKFEKVTLSDLRKFCVDTNEMPADTKVSIHSRDDQRDGYSVTFTITEEIGG